MLIDERFSRGSVLTRSSTEHERETAGRIDKRIQNHYFGFDVVIFLLLISDLNSQDLKDSLWAETSSGAGKCPAFAFLAWSLLASL